MSACRASQLLMVQLPNVDSLWLCSLVGATMSFGYSAIAIGMSAALGGCPADGNIACVRDIRLRRCDIGHGEQQRAGARRQQGPSSGRACVLLVPAASPVCAPPPCSWREPAGHAGRCHLPPRL